MRILVLAILFRITVEIDVFCGKLDVFNEQRFGQGAITVSSQVTSDLKQCLDVCCSIPNCDGVTFEGITSTDFDDSNCLLVSCDPTCQLNTPNKHSSGVLSVLIHRLKSNDTSIATPSPSTSSSMHPTINSSSSSSSYIPEIKSTFTPIWVLAVAICVAAICIGLNVTLCIAYCCYCRRKKRSQKAQISTVKGGPTLHAFNQEI